MGVASSKFVSNPGQFATPVTEDDATDFKPEKKSWKTYDYIICGGGTAGCVLASRLSENPDVSVLLIEAGKSHKGNLLVRIPLAFTQLFPTAVNWKYKTVPQTNLNSQPLAWDRGKILGGSSSVNASVYQRCSPENFATWEKAGAVGWGPAEMAKYFTKAEKYTPNSDFPDIDTTLHSNAGLSATRYGPVAPISATIIDSAVNVGIPRLKDMNNADKGPAGVSYFAASVDPRGERSSAATAYLTPEVLRRPNLTVAVETHVTRVVLEENVPPAEPRATGVLVRQKGRVFAAAARREVIVSTGAVVTPQLLMVSGLGPADELAKHDIHVVRELPMVGKNLLDHFSAGSLVLRAKAGKTWDHILSPMGGVVALGKWLISGTGEMASTAAPVGIFLHSESIVASPGKDDKLLDLSAIPAPGSGSVPDIEIFFAPFCVVDSGATKTPGMHGITVGSIAIDPKSRGTIALSSANMLDPPVIDPNYLSDTQDLRVLIKATRLALRLARAEPLASALALPADSTDESTYFWPGDADPDTVSDEALTKWIKRNGQTAWHPTSSAKMGTSSADSVVDASLRVHGVAGLRVVDASVFPTSVAGHPCAVIIAVAERAADLIKGAHSS